MFDETELLAEGDMEVYPLAVKAEASAVSQNESTDENPESGPTNSQITKAVFEKEKGEYKVRLVKQILWVNGMRYELQEIYEIGNSVNGDFDGNDSGKECVVCLSEPQDTTVLPCQHMLAEAAKAQFSHDYSDHLALFWAYKGWKEVERDVARYEYCWKNFLFAQTIKAIDALRGEFYSSLKEYVLNFNARWM